MKIKTIRNRYHICDECNYVSRIVMTEVGSGLNTNPYFYTEFCKVCCEEIKS